MLLKEITVMKGKEREREVVCGQVWWPILGICPLHLTHPSAHSQQWTHTRSSGQPYCGARGAVGGSVPCSRVSPQSWYWRWREHLLFTPPTDNPCRTWESNLQPLGYKSNSLTIRPRLPQPWGSRAPCSVCIMQTLHYVFVLTNWYRKNIKTVIYRLLNEREIRWLKSTSVVLS